MPKKEIIYENTAITNVGIKINIIHFNDVFNIESSTIEPKAGAPRFINAIEDIIKSDCSTLVLFSAISPSNCLSNFYQNAKSIYSKRLS